MCEDGRMKAIPFMASFPANYRETLPWTSEKQYIYSVVENTCNEAKLFTRGQAKFKCGGFDNAQIDQIQENKKTRDEHAEIISSTKNPVSGSSAEASQRRKKSNYSSFQDLRSSCNGDMVKYEGPRPSTTRARALNKKSNKKVPPATSEPPDRRPEVVYNPFLDPPFPMADDQPMWGNNQAVVPTPGAAIFAGDDLGWTNFTVRTHLSMTMIN
ncbi:hypothetical protein Tco_1274558 [Tanacetum coccineum]